MPASDITSKASGPTSPPFNCKTAPLFASVKYLSSPYTAKLSGLLLIPNSSSLAICCPKTVGTEVKVPPPPASVSISLPCNTYDILSSWNVSISVLRA